MVSPVCPSITPITPWIFSHLQRRLQIRYFSTDIELALPTDTIHLLLPVSTVTSFSACKIVNELSLFPLTDIEYFTCIKPIFPPGHASFQNNQGRMYTPSKSFTK